MSSVKIFCNACKRVTNHDVIHSHKQTEENEWYDSDEDGHPIRLTQLAGVQHYQIVACKGCESVSYRTTEWWSGMDEDWVSIYPDRTSPPNQQATIGFYEPKVVEGVPPQIRKVFDEVIQAYNSNLTTLCSAGPRVVVESVCQFLGMEGYNLEVKINNLKASGKISHELAQALQDHRWLGNKAVHSLFSLDKQELKPAIELLEIMLETVFGVPQRRIEFAAGLTNRALE